MVTGLRSPNTSPASGFSVSFNEETSPTARRQRQRGEERRRRWFSNLLQWLRSGFYFYFILTPIQGQLELQASRLSQNLETETGRKIFFQRLKINWTRFLLLNLLTACHPINSPSVLLCCGLPQGLKLKSEMLSQIFPQQTLGNVMWGNILLLYLLRKIPKGRCILLMPALAPC